MSDILLPFEIRAPQIIAKFRTFWLHLWKLEEGGWGKFQSQRLEQSLLMHVLDFRHVAWFRGLTYNVFTANTLCHAVTLTSDPLTLYVSTVSIVKWPNYVPNFSEIEQSAAELLRSKYGKLGRCLSSWIMAIMHQRVKFRHHQAMKGWVVGDSTNFTARFSGAGVILHRLYLGIGQQTSSNLERR